MFRRGDRCVIVGKLIPWLGFARRDGSSVRAVAITIEAFDTANVQSYRAGAR